jgi:hypothetical protein
MPSNNLAARYRQKAAECLEASGLTLDPDERTKLLGISYAYYRLAEQAPRWAALNENNQITADAVTQVWVASVRLGRRNSS